MKHLPARGFVFWPVGTGDSTTVAAVDDLVMQVDLHHMACADDDGGPHEPVVERLVELLPRRGSKPYLAVFVLTHPDQDHCRGFAELLDRVVIGEIWHSPRVFREYKKDLCDDAKAFRDEAKRRVDKTIVEGGDVESGDRVRLIGYDKLLEEDELDGFPPDRLTVPGNAVSELDGRDASAAFRAFVHAPFKDDSDTERNDASVAMQVTLENGKAIGQAMLLGDLAYPSLRKIYDVSDDSDVSWNAFLAPHHCSKSAMYWKEPEDDEEALRPDILKDIESSAGSPGYIISSSEPIPSHDKDGSNPPHRKAADHHRQIAPDGFFCTQETPSEKSPKPIVLELTDEGLVFVDKPERGTASESGGLAAAAVSARGTSQPPRDKVGFGRPPAL